MSDYLIGRDGLNELDSVIGLKVRHLVFDLSNDLEVRAAEHQLSVDVDLDGNLAHGILHEQDHSSLQCRLEVDATRVLDEESDLTLVIGRLQIDVTSHEMSTTATSIVFETLIDLSQSRKHQRLVLP